jgi:hypothetical protein
MSSATDDSSESEGLGLSVKEVRNRPFVGT